MPGRSAVDDILSAIEQQVGAPTAPGSGVPATPSSSRSTVPRRFANSPKPSIQDSILKAIEEQVGSPSATMAQPEAQLPSASITPALPPAQPGNGVGPTIGPAPEPSLFQRAKSTIANSAIGHAVSEELPKVANELGIEPTETVYNPDEARHANELIAPGAAFDKSGAAKGVAEFAGGLTTPGNMLLGAGSAGLGEFASLLGESASTVVPKLISLGFSAQMAQNAARQWPKIKQAWSEHRYDDAKQLATEAGLGILFSAAAFKHAGSEEAVDYGATLDRSKAAPPEPLVEGDTVPDYLSKVRQRVADQIAATPEKSASPAPAPETTSTDGHAAVLPTLSDMVKQRDELANGSRRVIRFPRGVERVPAPPEDSEVTVIPGNKPGAGTYYHDPSITPEQIHSAVKDGTINELLGAAEPIQEASAESAAVAPNAKPPAPEIAERRAAAHQPLPPTTSEPQPAFETAARDALLRGPARETAPTEMPNAEETGTPRKPGLYEKAATQLSSGIDPTMLKHLVPERVREYVSDEAEANRRARSLQSGLYDLDSQAAADLIRARNVLKEAPGTPADQEAIYHHLEDPTEPLTGTQRSILTNYLQPLLNESERINTKLGGGEVENYVHRIPVGKGSALERALNGEANIGSGRGLSRGAASSKGRVMMALEDEGGNRRVVAIKGGNVTGFDDNGKPESLGNLRTGLQTKGEIIDSETAPLRKELSKLETERRTLTATKSRQEAARRRIANIENRAAELRQRITHADESKAADSNGHIFVDRNGKQWRIAQATTKEIESETGTRYYKNATASTVLNFLNLRKAERAFDFLEGYKTSPDFAEVAHKITNGSAPTGWRATDLPQFHGYVFEPHTAEVLDWYAKRMKYEGPNLYRQVGDFLRTAIFFNPLIHIPNIGVHWIVEKGVTGAGPQNWARVLRSGSRAIDAVIHQNDDFLTALDEGAPLQSARQDRGAVTELLVNRMGRELEANPSAAQKIAKVLGYANPAKLVRAVYRFSRKATWLMNDVAVLQATYEHMDRTGQSFKDAITDISKHIPDYRLPTRIFNSTAAAKLMSNPDLTMFGAYHYGALRSYGEMVKSLVSEHVPPAERLKALDRMAMLGLVTYVVYPQLDKLAKLITGDKTAQFRRAGASTFIWNLAQLIKGDRTPTDVLEAIATPAVHTKTLAELALNRNFYTGRRIYDTSAPAGEMVKQVGEYAAKQVAPIGQAARISEGRQTIPQFVAGLAGIHTHVRTPAERLAMRLAMERTPASDPAAEIPAKVKLARDLEDQLRQGSISPKRLGSLVRGGQLTVEQAVKIYENSQTPMLEHDFRQLPIEDALRVWTKADAGERKMLRSALIAKALRLRPEDYTAPEWSALTAKIRNALNPSLPRKAPTAGYPVLRSPHSSIPFQPPG